MRGEANKETHELPARKHGKPRQTAPSPKKHPPGKQGNKVPDKTGNLLRGPDKTGAPLIGR